MSEPNPILFSMRESAGLRLAVLFGSFFILLILSSIIGAGIDALPIDARNKILITSGVQCLLAFCFPAIILARFSSNKWKEWLCLTKTPKIRSFAGVLIVYFISLPAMEWLIEWNSQLHLPESMAALEQTLRGWEETANATTEILLETHGFFPVLAGVLVVGVLTGFSEELFFRGGLQGILVKSSMHPGTAVWIAAIIFSTMHFQFFGFFPRLLMGVFFGFLLLWSGSIWLPVFAHLLNNSVVVILSSVTGNVSAGVVDSVSPGFLNENIIPVVISVILTSLLLIFFRNYLFKKDNNLELSWRKR